MRPGCAVTPNCVGALTAPAGTTRRSPVAGISRTPPSGPISAVALTRVRSVHFQSMACTGTFVGTDAGTDAGAVAGAVVGTLDGARPRLGPTGSRGPSGVPWVSEHAIATAATATARTLA